VITALLNSKNTSLGLELLLLVKQAAPNNTKTLKTVREQKQHGFETFVNPNYQTSVPPTLPNAVCSYVSGVQRSQHMRHAEGIPPLMRLLDDRCCVGMNTACIHNTTRGAANRRRSNTRRPK